MQKISKQHEVIKRYRELEKSTKNNEYISTSDINIIELAIKYNIKIDVFFYCDELEYKDQTKEIINKAIKLSSFNYVISKQTCESLVNKENGVGLFAILEVKNNGFEYIKNKDFLIICDGLEIPGNLGTIYRTMDSANVSGTIIVNEITKPFTSKVTTSSRGCNLLVPTWITSYEDALKYLLDNGYDVYLGEPKLGKCYKDYEYNGKVAIVVGNERFGINSDWYNNPHKEVYIPMYGSNNSLNVSVAASILIYEATLKKNIEK